MSEVHPSMARLYAATQKLGGQPGQSELARRLNTTPQRVKNWESRGLSLDGAIEAQRSMRVNATWLLFGEGSEFVNELGDAKPLERLDPAVLAAALRLVRLTLELLDTPFEPEDDANPVALAYAYLIKQSQRSVTADNVVDFGKYIKARSREGNDGDGSGALGASGRVSADREK